VQEHGGRIEVQSPPPPQQLEGESDGSGTVFVVHLPMMGVKNRDGKKEEISDGKGIGVG
jgi:signal transduction histidine kinase